MAIGLHALSALVLADLGLPTLLEIAHGLFGVGLILRISKTAIP